MVNYKNGKIYKIISNQTEKIYIGSTTKKYLCDRLYEHRKNFRCYQNGRLENSISSSEIIKYEDHHIILIETYPCNSKDELHSREQFYLNIFKDIVVNKQKAFTGLTKNEYNKIYRIENKESLKESSKKYYTENKESIIEKKKKYRIENKESIKEYSKKHYIKNIESIKEYQKKYGREKINCECSGRYTRSHKSTHDKSKMHQKWLAMNKIIDDKINNAINTIYENFKVIESMN